MQKLSIAAISAVFCFSQPVLGKAETAPAAIDAYIQQETNLSGSNCHVATIPVKSERIAPTIWYVLTPIRCDEDGFWNWGGTAGPEGLLFSLVDGHWQLARLGRVRNVEGNGHTISLSQHHVACSNSAQVGCLTHFTFSPTGLVTVRNNYEQGPFNFSDVIHWTRVKSFNSEVREKTND